MLHYVASPRRALASPMRRAILQELRANPLAVGEIAERLPVSGPAILRHLRILEEAGLVEAKENGTRNVYSVRLQGFASVREIMDDFWAAALAPSAGAFAPMIVNTVLSVSSAEGMVSSRNWRNRASA